MYRNNKYSFIVDPPFLCIWRRKWLQNDALLTGVFTYSEHRFSAFIHRRSSIFSFNGIEFTTVKIEIWRANRLVSSLIDRDLFLNKTPPPYRSVNFILVSFYSHQRYVFCRWTKRNIISLHFCLCVNAFLLVSNLPNAVRAVHRYDAFGSWIVCLSPDSCWVLSKALTRTAL